MAEYDYKKYVKAYDARETTGGYNKQYETNMREMDKLIFEYLISNERKDSTFKLLDLGCGNGNFLRQLKNHFPKSALSGKDMAKGLIDQCKSDPTLTGINFDNSDILDEPGVGETHAFDYVMLIGVICCFNLEQIKKALKSIHLYLKPGGSLLNIDGYHDYAERDLIAVELYPKTDLSPKFEMMKYFYPSKEKMQDLLHEVGFGDAAFQSFSMPFDIPNKPRNPFATHTVRTVDGQRLSMLGIVAQPYCFLSVSSKERDSE